MNPFMSGCTLPKGKFFHLHFLGVWIGSRSTFVLCTALLTGRLSLSDVLELPQLLDHRLLKSTCYQFVNSEL